MLNTWTATIVRTGEVGGKPLWSVTVEEENELGVMLSNYGSNVVGTERQARAHARRMSGRKLSSITVEK